MNYISNVGTIQITCKKQLLRRCGSKNLHAGRFTFVDWLDPDLSHLREVDLDLPKFQ